MTWLQWTFDVLLLASIAYSAWGQDQDAARAYSGVAYTLSRGCFAAAAGIALCGLVRLIFT